MRNKVDITSSYPSLARRSGRLSPQLNIPTLRLPSFLIQLVPRLHEEHQITHLFLQIRHLAFKPCSLSLVFSRRSIRPLFMDRSECRSFSRVRASSMSFRLSCRFSLSLC